jgi:hypothetical protein
VAEGPWGWRNWRADASEAAERVEVMLYTDAHVTGELRALGPYEFLNAIPATSGEIAPTVVLRAMIRQPQRGLETPEGGFETPDEVTTDASGYHGGNLFDELGALLSLALGIRCQSGGMTRRWPLTGGEEGDPLGHPYEFSHRPPYYPAPSSRGEPIPSLRRTVSLDDAVPYLAAYPELEAAVATAGLRAARLYQQAVWISRTDPSQAWVQLVSALEVAADSWLGKKWKPEARLEEFWPELASDLEDLAPGKRAAVAAKLASLVKATQRFLTFMKEFGPEAPTERPPPAFQVDWGQVQEALKVIYKYRSLALHAGTPFPAPMCEPPHYIEGKASEIPIGLATATADAVWTIADTPTLLSTFEWIARSALTKWWLTASRA